VHIADGIVPVQVCLAADAVALAGVALSSRKLKAEEIPRLGIFTAALFIVSLIHFPLAGTSLHLSLFGLVGLMFGKRAFPVIFISLLFQALVFQHGGLLTLGVNALAMGSGALAGWLIWDVLPINRRVNAFFCGFLGIMLPVLLISSLFLLIDYGKGMAVLLWVYLPVSLLEGTLTTAAVSFFLAVEPGLLKR